MRNRPFSRIIVVLGGLACLLVIGWLVLYRPQAPVVSESTDPAVLRQARQARAEGRMDQAVSLLSAHIAGHPHDAPAWYERGFCYALQGSHEAAISDFTRVVGLQPEWGAAYNNRAWERLQLHQLGPALEDADQAVRLSSDSAEAWDTRACILLALNRPEEALQSIGSALKIRPNFGTAIEHRLEIQHALALRAGGPRPDTVAVPASP